MPQPAGPASAEAGEERWPWEAAAPLEPKRRARQLWAEAPGRTRLELAAERPDGASWAGPACPATSDRCSRRASFAPPAEAAALWARARARAREERSPPEQAAARVQAEREEARPQPAEAEAPASAWEPGPARPRCRADRPARGCRRA